VRETGFFERENFKSSPAVENLQFGKMSEGFDAPDEAGGPGFFRRKVGAPDS
jgi:hypothetical protein